MKEKAPSFDRAFIEKKLVFIFLAGPTRLELATSGLTEQSKISASVDIMIQTGLYGCLCPPILCPLCQKYADLEHMQL